jgi:SAM-dependent methyltransferase
LSFLQEAKSARILHIGCGYDRIENAVRLDVNESVQPDVRWDLSKRPYPFDDESFDFVIAQSVIEHLDDILDVMGEIHRILTPGGRCIVLCPHFSSASCAIDPTHKQTISASSFDYFVPGTDLEKAYGYYVGYRFAIRKRMVSLQGWWGWIPFLESSISRRPQFWENHLCYIVRGAGVYWDLIALR